MVGLEAIENKKFYIVNYDTSYVKLVRFMNCLAQLYPY